MQRVFFLNLFLRVVCITYCVLFLLNSFLDIISPIHCTSRAAQKVTFPQPIATKSNKSTVPAATINLARCQNPAFVKDAKRRKQT